MLYFTPDYMDAVYENSKPFMAFLQKQGFSAKRVSSCGSGMQLFLMFAIFFLALCMMLD